MPSARPIESTRDELIVDIDYAAELNYRHRKLYQLLRLVFGFAFIASGSTVLATLQLGTGTQVGLSVVVTVLGILSVMIDPGSKAEQHHQLRQRYLALRKEVAGLEAAEIESRLQDLYADSLYVVRSLELPAWNSNLCRHGREDALRPLTRFQRFMGWLT